MWGSADIILAVESGMEPIHKPLVPAMAGTQAALRREARPCDKLLSQLGSPPSRG